MTYPFRLTGLLLTLATCPALAASEHLVHRFLELSVSPDGTAIADIEGDVPPSGREPIVRDLVIRRSDGASSVTIELPCGRVAECWPSSPSWSADSKQLVFALRSPGTHARTLYSVSATGTALTKLLAFDGTIIDLRHGPEGRLAMLATQNAVKEVGATQAGAAIQGDLNAATPQQRIALLKDGVLTWASPPNLFVYEYDWRPDGRGFIGTAAPGDGDDNWWFAKLYAFDGGDATARLLYAPTDARQQLAEPRISPDGRSVLFVGGIMSDFGSTGGDLYRIPVNGGVATNLTRASKASVTSIGFDCSGQTLMRVLRGDRIQLVSLDAKDAPHTLWSAQQRLLGHEAGVSLGCPSGVSATVREGFEAPPEIYVGSLGNWHALTNLNSGWQFDAQVRSIHWKSDGYDVQGWLLLPPHSSGSVPLITDVHGGPAAAWEPRFEGPGINRALLEQGYAIFRPNPRGSFGQGEAFTLANVRDFGHGDLRDIMRGIDAAGRGAPIDPKRLGITGGSYGGYFTMWAVTQTQRFKAAVADAGVSDWLSYYGENGIDGWMIPYFGASVYNDPASYARSSPINFIRNVRTPTFEYVGANDIECPAPQTQEFWHALHDLGVPTQIVIYPHEGHGLRDPAHLADAQQRVLDWFGKYLKP